MRPRLLPLPSHNLHCVVRIVQIIPPGRLMRRIPRPHHAEVVNPLRFRAIHAAVGPGRGAEVAAVGEEGGEGEGDDVGEVRILVGRTCVLLGWLVWSLEWGGV